MCKYKERWWDWSLFIILKIFTEEWVYGSEDSEIKPQICFTWSTSGSSIIHYKPLSILNGDLEFHDAIRLRILNWEQNTSLSFKNAVRTGWSWGEGGVGRSRKDKNLAICNKKKNLLKASYATVRAEQLVPAVGGLQNLMQLIWGEPAPEHPSEYGTAWRPTTGRTLCSADTLPNLKNKLSMWRHEDLRRRLYSLITL